MYWSIEQLPALSKIPEDERKKLIRKVQWQDSFGIAIRFSVFMIFIFLLSYVSQKSDYYKLVNEKIWLKILVYSVIVVVLMKCVNIFYLNTFLARRINRFIND